MRARDDACRRFQYCTENRSWVRIIQPADEQELHVVVTLPQVHDSLVTADYRRTEFAAPGVLRSAIVPSDPCRPKLSRHYPAHLILLQREVIARGLQLLPLTGSDGIRLGCTSSVHSNY
jgi:hypothetical protein